MRRWLAASLMVACASGTAPSAPPVATVSAAPVSATAPDAEAPVPPSPPDPLACIARYYDGVARHDADGWSLVLPNGQAIYETRSANPAEPFSLKDIYEQVYPTGTIQPITEVDFDPGRVRIDALFFSRYGRTAKEVQAALVPVKLGGATMYVHRKIAEPLGRVNARLEQAMKKDPTLGRFFTKLGGTFNWRVIAGTEDLSMHSWGIAIDLSTERAHYWRNEPQNRPLAWKNSYPQAIVDAFESEGFVWGGRWYHFDTMHFEYRPELLDRSCYPK